MPIRQKGGRQHLNQTSMKYLSFSKNNYTEVKNSKVLDEFNVTTEVLEEIADWGHGMFWEYDCPHPVNPVNEVVFSDEEPIYDFSETLEKIERESKEFEEINIDKAESIVQNIIRGKEDIKFEESQLERSFRVSFWWILERIERRIFLVKECLMDGGEITDEFKNELEALIQQIDNNENGVRALDEINKLINRILRTYKNTIQKHEKLISIDTKSFRQNILRLGEYKPETRTIVLYYNNIKKTEPARPDALMKVVFMHELMHALLHPSGSVDNFYSEKLEEPICEYGALCLASRYDNGNLFDLAHEYVANKKNCVPLHHYGFGSYLYDREKLETEENPCGRFIIALYLLKAKELTSPSRLKNAGRFNSLIDAFNDVFYGNEEYPRDSQKVLFDKLFKLKFRRY